MHVHCNPTPAAAAASAELRIALVNNMPDAALATVERQFASLVAASCGELNVHLGLIRAVDGSPFGRDAPGDGAEPRAADLADEPYWLELTRLIEWARSGVVAAAPYSCLAAHAAARMADAYSAIGCPPNCAASTRRRWRNGMN